MGSTKRSIVPNTYTDGKVVKDSYLIMEGAVVAGEVTWVRPGFWNCLYWDDRGNVRQAQFETEEDARSWAQEQG